MIIVTVIGARPQFIKAAVISRELKLRGVTEILVHTGQHYDTNMSDIFFAELEIAKPSYNLGIGSASHGDQTGQMLAGIEKILLEEKPDYVLVYGDTNSTLAGALAATKLHIKVAHIEAGLRSYNRLMPEEINRVLTDHVSNLLFCPSEESVQNLAKEGITHSVHNVGDVMYDAVKFAVAKNQTNQASPHPSIPEKEAYFLVTLHRAETTDDPARLGSILNFLNSLDENVVFPVHPRTRIVMNKISFKPSSRVNLIEPVGYFEMIRLEQNARLIMTDSGGVQKEAYWLNVPCLTLRTETEWVETIKSGWNRLVGYNIEEIRAALKSMKAPLAHPLLYGKEDCVDRIVNLLMEK